QVPVRSRQEAELGQAQLLLRQVEEGAFADEQRPMLAIAAALQAHPLEKRRRQTVEAKSVDDSRLAEIRLEAARPQSIGVDRGDRKDHGSPESRRRRRVADEQIADLFTARVVDAQIVQSGRED